MNVAEEFREVAALAPDWDGEGADKPSEVAMANARRFLEEIVSIGEPSIGACANGSIDLFWKAGERLLLMNFTARGRANFYAEIAGLKFRGSTGEPSGDL